MISDLCHLVPCDADHSVTRVTVEGAARMHRTPRATEDSVRPRTFTWVEEKSAIFSDIARNIRLIVGADEGARLLGAFSRIGNPLLRRSLVQLVEELAGDAPEHRPRVGVDRRVTRS